MEGGAASAVKFGMNSVRPVEIKAAAGLILVVYFSGLLVIPGPMWMKPGTYAGLAVLGGIVLLKVWSIWTGRNWGRWVVAVLYVLTITGVFKPRNLSSVQLGLLWVQMFLTLVAVILLFTPAGNRWFKPPSPPILPSE